MKEENQVKILIVDDNPVNCRVLVNSLEEFEEYKLLVAHNGVKAVAIAEKVFPDLLLLDINMPEMNGFEVCEHLKSNPETRDIPIIFLSALDDIDSKIKGFNVGGVDYVTKPFHREEVLKRVETQIKIRRLTESLQSRNQILLDKNNELARLLKEIGQMKSQLQESHEQITGSITYAERIQRAFLPTHREILRIFPQHFVIYKPRDIVSGDFYLFEEKDGKLIAAAIDCTGHGVPGALMSVIGHTQLSNIISENSSLKPSDMLQELDLRVRQLLKQDEGEFRTHDGMDMNLSVYDPASKILSFAGANLPIIRYREGEELFEIRGDVLPIGGSLVSNKVFTTHELEMLPGDVIYLFSDGFIDQFGGENGRKLTRRRFKEILQEIGSVSLEQQEQILQQFLADWQGEHEQTDDITVIAIKF